MFSAQCHKPSCNAGTFLLLLRKLCHMQAVGGSEEPNIQRRLARGDTKEEQGYTSTRRASLKEGVEQKSITFSFPMHEMFLTRGQDPRLSPCWVLSVPPDKATLSFGRVGKGLPCPKTQAAWEQMTRGSQHKSKSEEQSKTWPSHSPTPIPPGSPNPHGTAAQTRPISNPPLQ